MSRWLSASLATQMGGENSATKPTGEQVKPAGKNPGAPEAKGGAGKTGATGSVAPPSPAAAPVGTSAPGAALAPEAFSQVQALLGQIVGLMGAHQAHWPRL